MKKKKKGPVMVSIKTQKVTSLESQNSVYTKFSPQGHQDHHSGVEIDLNRPSIQVNFDRL